VTITNRDKLACCERELAFRNRVVYTRLVVRGKMTKTEQGRELELMAAIVEDYRALVDPDAKIWRNYVGPPGEPWKPKEGR
jgi:hypothetical protein